MRVGIAALMSTIGGPRTVAINLIKHISTISPENKYFIFTDKIEDIPNNKNVEPTLIKLASPYTLPFWDNVKLPIQIRKNNIDVFHHTKNGSPRFCHCKSIATIHDIAPFLFPETFSTLQRIYMKLYILSAAKHADIIITVSSSSKRDIVNVTGVNENKVRVVYNGIADTYHKITDTTLLQKFRNEKKMSEKIILYAGTIQPRKNLDIVIRAFHKLKTAKKIPHKLIVVGRRGWLVNNLDVLVEELGLSKDVFFMGTVTDDKELAYFYNSAEIFVYPSSYEGFGLTPLEAMACGLPVISSNISSLPEVVGDAGVLVNPRNIDELASAMEMLLSDNKLRQEYSQKGLEKARQFSWEKTAKQTLDIYQELYK